MGFRSVGLSTPESSGHRLCQGRLEGAAVVRLKNLIMREVMRLASPSWLTRVLPACLHQAPLRRRVTQHPYTRLAREDPFLLAESWTGTSLNKHTLLSIVVKRQYALVIPKF